MEGWVIGVILSIAAALSAAVGDNLVKYSFEKEREKVDNGIEVGPIYKQPIWLIGNFCIMGLNTIFNLASYGFADASITIPFGGLHICFNLPLAYYINKERCSKRSILFNGLILFGVSVVLLTGNHSTQTFTPSELVDNLFQPTFLLFSILVFGLMGYIMLIMLKSPDNQKRQLGLTVFCGLIGCITQVFAKAMSECIGQAAWGHFFTYVCIGITLFLALSQVYYLNLCLDRFPAFFVVPIVNSTIIVFGSLYAAVYFQEIARWGYKSTVCVPLGIVLTSIGIGLLAYEPEDSEQHNEIAHSIEAELSFIDEPLVLDDRQSLVGSPVNQEEDYMRLDTI